MAQQDKQEEQDDWLKTRKPDKHFHCKSICLQTYNNSNYLLIIRHKQKHTPLKKMMPFLHSSKMYLGSWHKTLLESWHIFFAFNIKITVLTEFMSS